MSKVISYDDIIRMLAENYKEVESFIASQIKLRVDNHDLTTGTYRETVWKDLFEMIVPKKYCIEQGVFIIDSYGTKSKEVDLAIFDEMYTPYIFNYGKIKFIPIEAVAAVVECKSTKLNGEMIEGWRKSIENLHTSMDSVARMANAIVDNMDKELKATQTATRPIMILCAMASESEIAKVREGFDIALSVDGDRKKIFKYIKGEEDNLNKWNESLNHVLKIRDDDDSNIRQEKKDREDKRKTISDEQRKDLLKELKVEQINKDGELEENVLLSLIFQLNQLLMILNNPMLFPHRAYAKCFSDILKKSGEEEADGQKG